MLKRFAIIGIALGLMAVARPAQAALAFSFHVCQGGTCVDFPTNLVGTTPVGDYTFSAIGGGINATPTSSSSTSTINVQRTGSTSALPLDVWFTVTGYTLPTGPAYMFDVSLGVTETNSGATPGRDLVSYQAWFSATNGTGFPPAGSAPSNLASCTPLMTGTSDSCFSNPGFLFVGPGSTLFSIVTQTRFNIATSDTSTFGSTSQASLTGVPEPGSMVLLGTGLVGMAGLIRRRMAKK